MSTLTLKLTLTLVIVGPAGLYTALILDDLDIPYHMLEAQDRVGGRLFTYKFGDDFGSPHNYYDVGAMRFPHIKPMIRLWNLFNYEHLNKGNDPLSDRLRPYIFGDDTSPTFRYFNGMRYRANAVPPPSDDPFKSKAVIFDTNAQPYIEAGAEDILNDIVYPFATALLHDLDHNETKGWELLMKFDNHSARSYMSTVYRPSKELKLKYPSLPDTHLSTDIVNWLETFQDSTGGYDRALSETILDVIAFGWRPPSPDPTPQPNVWHCIEFVTRHIQKPSSTNFIFFQWWGPISCRCDGKVHP